MEKGDIIIRQIFPKEAPLYSQVLNLRNQLLRIPIGLDLFQEDLSQEVNQVTLAAITDVLAKSNDNNESNSQDIDKNPARNTGKNEEVLGCVLLAPVDDGETFKLRQMAVSPASQGIGLGSKLVAFAEKFAKEQGKTRLYLHGRKHAVEFYLKQGFKQISEEFLELGIPHYALEKKLL